jgi:hypothetical protein
MVGGSMNGSLKVVQAIVLLSFVGIFFTSCGGNQTTLGSTASGTTTGGNTGQSSGTQSIEDEEKNATIPSGYDATNLFVTVPDSIDYFNFNSLHNVASSRCTFNSSSAVNDLTCTVHAGELALYKEGLKLQFNIPTNQCKYMGTLPYWYYNREVGTGPTDVVVLVNKDSSGTITSTSCQVDGGATASCTTATPPANWGDIEFDIAEDISVKCKYDKSDEDGGANCCFGKYRLRTNVITPDGASPTDERGKAWGGNVTSCIGGPGKTDWDNKSAEGYPAYLIEKVNPNVPRTKIIRVTAPIDTIENGTTIPVANYFTQGLHRHTGFGTASGTRFSNYPYFVDPVSDRTGSAVLPGNPFYTFDCMDAAFEVNYRIKVMVQDWDTVAALSAFAVTGVSGTPVTTVGNDTGTADEPGFAPDECPGLAGDSCNNAPDNDDFVRAIPWTSYSNAFPASRTYYFPSY